MPFLIMITLGTLLIASAAIFFSVLGLVQTFSETALYWGTAIEIAKLVLASFVYRYWDKMETLSKMLGVFFVGLLMVITSLGISGHILSSMQQGDLELTAQQIQTETANSRISRIQERIDFVDQRIEQGRSRLEAIDEEIALVPNNFVTARRQLIQERQPEKDQIQKTITGLFDERDALFLQIEQAESERGELSLETKQIEVKVGPIVKVVETFGADAAKAIYIFILIIVLSFDPVAVYLTVAANRVAIDIRMKKEQKDTMDESPRTGSKMISGKHIKDDGKLDNIVETMSYIKDRLKKEDEKKQQFRDSLS